MEEEDKEKPVERHQKQIQGLTSGFLHCENKPPEDYFISKEQEND